MTAGQLFDRAAQRYDQARRQLVPCFDELQLQWLAEIGFTNLNCRYQWYRFAVYSGEKFISERP
jgi:hypothetical protein